MAIGDTVGATIRRLREARDLSQEALARKAGLARLTVIRIETGSQSPTLDSLERVAKALGVRLRALIPDN
jgi:transcriptional regulator with XRE-family HTH domain